MNIDEPLEGLTASGDPLSFASSPSYWSPTKLPRAVELQLAEENIARSWSFTPLIVVVMVLYLSLDGAAIERHAAMSEAQAAAPLLLALRFFTALTGAAWMARSWTRHVDKDSARRVMTEYAVYMGLLLGENGMILGVYEWFAPSAGYYLAAMFFVSVFCMVPTRLAVVTLGLGLAGMFAPLVFGPHPPDSGLLVQLTFMSFLGLAVNRVLYVLHASAVLNVQVITKQRDSLNRLNHALRDALGQAESSRRLATDAAAARARFLAHMSHEIRSPVHGIIGLTQIALDGGLTAEHERRAKVVLGTAKTLLAMVNNVLDFSRADAGGYKYERVPMSVSLAVRDVLDSLAPMAEAKGLRIESALACPAVVGDDTRLRQVLFNLVGNAIKFTDVGEVVVTTRYEDEHLVLTVRDTGVGVPADRVDMIFQPFEQAAASTSRRYGGTGLGLAIVARVIADQGGAVTVESTVGKGSCFTVRLPAARVDATASEVSEAADASACPPEIGREVTVLVVDDMPASRMILERFIAKMGYNTRCAVTAEAALEVLQTDVFDLVLVDIELPGISGFEMAVRLRSSDGPNQKVPLVAVTGHSRDHVHEQMMGAGVEHHLHKPFSYDQVEQLVVAALGAQPSATGGVA